MTNMICPKYLESEHIYTNALYGRSLMKVSRAG